MGGNAQPVIRWLNVYTGWLYLARQLEQFVKPQNGEALSQDSVDRVSAILALISTLLSSNDKIAAALPKYMQAGDDTAAPNLLSILFQLVEVAPLLPPALTVRKLATRALRCVAGLARTFPSEVWLQFGRRSLLDPARLYGDGTAAAGGAIRRLLQREELSQGRYTVTLSFLDLLQSVLGHMLQWPLNASQQQHAVAINPQDFLRCLRYVRSDVLSSYYSWKYVKVSERWEMGIQILSILRQVLTDVRPTRTARDQESLQQSVRQSLAADTAFHHVLLSVAGLAEKALFVFEFLNLVDEGIGYDVLMKKSEAGQFGDRQTLEQLVICGLTLLEQIMEHSPSLVDALLNKVSETKEKKSIPFCLLKTYVSDCSNWAKRECLSRAHDCSVCALSSRQQGAAARSSGPHSTLQHQRIIIKR